VRAALCERDPRAGLFRHFFGSATFITRLDFLQSFLLQQIERTRNLICCGDLTGRDTSNTQRPRTSRVSVEAGR